MRFSVATIVSVAFAGLASASSSLPPYTTPVGAEPSGNSIYEPALNEIVPAGEPYTITWDPTTTGTVTLVLLRGPSTNILPLSLIADKIPNTGTYSWTPSTGLVPDTTGYGIQLIVDATGAYQYTSQFGISNSQYSISSVEMTSTIAQGNAPVTQVSDGQVQAATTPLQYYPVSQIGDGQIQAPVTAATSALVSATPTAVSFSNAVSTSALVSSASSTAAATVITSSPIAVGTGFSVMANSTTIQATGSGQLTLRTSTFTPSGSSTGDAPAITAFSTGGAGRVAKSAGGTLMGLGALVVLLM
ncbi:MAG: hypothetical protein Q9187_006144 [Circinaria calcarea]